MATYYFSPTGSNVANGLSAGTAWNSSTDTKFNTTSWSPGDTILFQGSANHTGNFLITNSGTAGNVITISSYGTGMPIILAGTGFALKALNCSYITIDGIHAIGSGVETLTGYSDNHEWGISAATNQTTGVYTDIIIKNCKIGDGTGENSYGGFMVGIGVYSDAEIYFQKSHARIDNILFHNNDITNTNMTGLMTYAAPDVTDIYPAQSLWAGTFTYNSSITGGTVAHKACVASASTPQEGAYIDKRPVITGQNFTVNNPNGITITQLGAWDNNGDGIDSPGIDVAILDLDTKTIVRTINITGMGDAYVGFYRMKNVTPFVLPVGNYSIATFGHKLGNEALIFWGGSPKGDEGNGSITILNKLTFSEREYTAMEYPLHFGLSRDSFFPAPLGSSDYYNDIFRNVTATYNYIHDTYGYNNRMYMTARAGTGLRFMHVNGGMVEHNKVTRCGHMGKNDTNGVPMGVANLEFNTCQSITIRYNESSYASRTPRTGAPSNVDAIGIDAFDDRAKNTICEFNWVHNNEGEAFGYGAHVPGTHNVNNILRFNVTYNNQNGTFNFAGGFKDFYMYNNLIMDPYTAGTFQTQYGSIINGNVFNNIFYVYSDHRATPPPLKIVGNVYENIKLDVNNINLATARSVWEIEQLDNVDYGRIETIVHQNPSAPAELPIGQVQTFEKYKFVSSYDSELSLTQLQDLGMSLINFPTTDFNGNAFSTSNLKPGPFQTNTPYTPPNILNLGTTLINGIKLGSQKITKIYKGSTQIWNDPGVVAGASTYNFTKTLKYKNRNNEVLELQKKLISLGYSIKNPNGYFGIQTTTAVKAFQKANKLSSDGIVGGSTRKKLNTV